MTQALTTGLASGGEGAAGDAASRAGLGVVEEASPALRTRPQAVGEATVRRLTPLECTRLQGFEDEWLDVTPPLSDSAKYRALGNAVCAAVSNWIGWRWAAWQRGWRPA